MIMRLLFLALVFISTVTAYKLPKVSSPILKNKVIQQVIAGSLLACTLTGPISLPNSNFDSFKVSAAEMSSVFVGNYNDPNHPGCLRKVEEKNSDIIITGSDSADGSNLWVLKAKQSTPNEILVDFSPKGGPKDLLGKYNEKFAAIQWPDGNSWTKK